MSICFGKVQYYSSVNCPWVQKLVITILSASLAYEKRVTSFELRKKDLALDRSSKLRRLVVLKKDKKPERNSGSHAGIRTHDVRGLSMEGNLRFKIDWTSLIVGRKFTVLFCFTLYLREISNYKPLGGLYLEGLIQRRVFCEFGGVIIGGAYTWGGLFSEFYDNLTESGSTWADDYVSL